VIGILDDRLGEEVKAVVALRPGTELTGPELIAYCKERIAAYKYPRVVEFRDAPPRNTLGKVLKDELAPPQADAAGEAENAAGPPPRRHRRASAAGSRGWRTTTAGRPRRGSAATGRNERPGRVDGPPEGAVGPC
jgi:AMP-binding enzyme C-terminal domain